jgi:hypothetical protein
MGDRPSSYDYWPQTSLEGPRWLGTTVHLVGGGEKKWARALRFERIEREADDAPFLLGIGYGGVRERSIP